MPRQHIWLAFKFSRLLSLVLPFSLAIILFGQQFNPAIAQPQNGSAAKGIKVEENIFYAPQHSLSQALDLYLPERKPYRPLPVVIFIHGGGWQAGDKKDGRDICQEFVRRGYAAASLNYRFANQAIWPAQAIDCKAAVRWLRANAMKYDLDANRFVVGGHSAGGHLSAFLATTNGVKLYDQGQNLQVSSDVQAELWFAGVANLISRATAHGYQGEQNPKSGESRLLGGPVMLRRHLALGASPVTWVSKNTVPFFFEEGTLDNAVPPSQVLEMKAALDKFGIYSEVYFLPGVGHVGSAYFDLEHYNLMDAFLQKVLKIDRGKRVGNSVNDGNDGDVGGGARTQESLAQDILSHDCELVPVSAPNLVLSAPDPKSIGDARVLFEQPLSSQNQKWRFISAGAGYYSIRPCLNQNFAISVAGNSTANKTPVFLTAYGGAQNQLWKVIYSDVGGLYHFSPRCAPNSVLENFSGRRTPGGQADIWQYNSSDDHLQWYVRTSSLPHQEAVALYPQVKTEVEIKEATIDSSVPTREKRSPGTQRLALNVPNLWMFPPPYWNGICFRELFENPEQWAQTRSKINGVGYADHWLDKEFSDNERRIFFAHLKEWNLKLCLEVGAINKNNQSGDKAFEALSKRIDKFKSNGGEIWGIAMDEPLAQTKRFSPATDVVGETAKFIALIREKYPEIVVGDIESHPYVKGSDLIYFEDRLNETLKQMHVRGIQFVRLDVDWMHFRAHDAIGKDGWRGVVQIQQAFQRRHIPFSLIYWSADFPSLNQKGQANKDTWEKAIIQQAKEYREAGGSPDEYLIESWVETPSHSTPENESGTFTHSVLRFAKLIGSAGQ